MVQTLMILVLTITTLGLSSQNIALRLKNKSLMVENQVANELKVQPEFATFVASYLNSYKIQAKLNPTHPVLKQTFNKVEVKFEEISFAAPNQPFRSSCEKKNGEVSVSLTIPRDTWRLISNPQQKQMLIDHTFNECINTPEDALKVGKAPGVFI